MDYMAVVATFSLKTLWLFQGYRGYISRLRIRWIIDDNIHH